jgi:ArsR family transcriptional regulator, arsenate/arsenite/antimonite-responsive transcriptional repressor
MRHSVGKRFPDMEDVMIDWRELKQMTKALADVARLTIVYHLAHEDEITVTVLTERLGISQPLVSWHLRKLRRAGLIMTRRVGRQVYCSLNRHRFQACLQNLERLVDPGLQAESLPTGETLIEIEAATEVALEE